VVRAKGLQKATDRRRDRVQKSSRSEESSFETPACQDMSLELN
jgi:hypothetical protein